jgi:hypothetical protein
MEGQLLSGPSGGASFWIDALDQPHADNVESQFQIAWPDGQTCPFGLNGPRKPSQVELYTPAIGRSTLTHDGTEVVLASAGHPPWLPLRIGQTYNARVREIRRGGNTPLSLQTMVLSLGPKFPLPQSLQTGAILRISTASRPALHGIKTAISGGPLIVHDGEPVRLNVPDSDSYQVGTMKERHPRAAIGWNSRSLFLVEIDGRQKWLSVGMTLPELARLLAKLGCQEAMNLDGGGSATLWYEGEVRNSPCDRKEREIANCLVVMRNER